MQCSQAKQSNSNIHIDRVPSLVLRRQGGRGSYAAHVFTAAVQHYHLTFPLRQGDGLPSSARREGLKVLFEPTAQAAKCQMVKLVPWSDRVVVAVPLCTGYLVHRMQVGRQRPTTLRMMTVTLPVTQNINGDSSDY